MVPRLKLGSAHRRWLVKLQAGMQFRWSESWNNALQSATAISAGSIGSENLCEICEELADIKRVSLVSARSRRSRADQHENGICYSVWTARFRERTSNASSWSAIRVKSLMKTSEHPSARFLYCIRTPNRIKGIPFACRVDFRRSLLQRLIESIFLKSEQRPLFTVNGKFALQSGIVAFARSKRATRNQAEWRMEFYQSPRDAWLSECRTWRLYADSIAKVRR